MLKNIINLAWLEVIIIYAFAVYCFVGAFIKKNTVSVDLCTLITCWIVLRKFLFCVWVPPVPSVPVPTFLHKWNFNCVTKIWNQWNWKWGQFKCSILRILISPILETIILFSCHMMFCDRSQKRKRDQKTVLYEYLKVDFQYSNFFSVSFFWSKCKKMSYYLYQDYHWANHPQ